jgi:hypothetical protein
MVMYYGGDTADLLLITTFFWQWFHAARPRRRGLRPDDGTHAVSMAS